MVSNMARTARTFASPFGERRRVGVQPAAPARVHQDVVPEQDLGDAGRLGAALDLERDREGHLDPAGTSSMLGQRGPGPQLEPTGTGDGNRSLLRP